MAEIDSNTMTKPGDVVIDEITLRSYTGFTMNLKGIFENFTLYEDMFSNCMSGSITLIDSLNIVKHFPIIGAETLTIKYRTPYSGSSLVKLCFRTYKISVRVAAIQPSTQMVRIEFVSHQSVKSMQRRISKSFVSMPVSKMVENIFNEYLAVTRSEMEGGFSPSQGGFGGRIVASPDREDDDGLIRIKTVEPTFDSRSYVIPYWTPLYAINWLAHRARSRYDTSLCDYVMYENSDGHHFVPISRLKIQPVSFTYTDYPQGFRSKSGDRMIESELRNIVAMTVEDVTDKVKQQTLGMLSSAVLTHDMTTKAWSNAHFKYDESFSYQGNHLEDNPLVPAGKTDYSNAVESHIRFYPSSTYTMKGLQNIHETEETVLLRQSLLNQINSTNLIVDCYGDTNVKVGQVVDLKIMSSESLKNKDDFEDEYLKGRYLVTTVKHVVTDREHLMTMTLSRDSFPEPLADFKKAELAIET